MMLITVLMLLLVGFPQAGWTQGLGPITDPSTEPEAATTPDERAPASPESSLAPEGEGAPASPQSAEQGVLYQRDSDLVLELSWERLRPIEAFASIYVDVVGSASVLGLRQADLAAYLQQTFDEHLTPIQYEGFSDRVTTLLKEKAEKVGYLACSVWTAGTTGPIAFHIDCQAGYFPNFPLWSQAALGYGTPDTIVSQTRETLTAMVQQLAA
ncbi:MAG: hypothetical protein ACREI3_08615, partial [Nitrospirales bacterium]